MIASTCGTSTALATPWRARAVTALGRYGTVDDIAATVAHLAGPGGAYITGTSITVDGGVTA